MKEGCSMFVGVCPADRARRGKWRMRAGRGTGARVTIRVNVLTPKLQIHQRQRQVVLQEDLAALQTGQEIKQVRHAKNCLGHRRPNHARTLTQTHTRPY